MEKQNEETRKWREACTLRRVCRSPALNYEKNWTPAESRSSKTMRGESGFQEEGGNENCRPQVEGSRHLWESKEWISALVRVWDQPVSTGDGCKEQVGNSLKGDGLTSNGALRGIDHGGTEKERSKVAEKDEMGWVDAGGCRGVLIVTTARVLGRFLVSPRATSGSAGALSYRYLLSQRFNLLEGVVIRQAECKNKPLAGLVQSWKRAALNGHERRRKQYLDVEIIEGDELFRASRIEDFQLEQRALECLYSHGRKWEKEGVAMRNAQCGEMNWASIALSNRRIFVGGCEWRPLAASDSGSRLFAPRNVERKSVGTVVEWGRRARGEAVGVSGRTTPLASSDLYYDQLRPRTLMEPRVGGWVTHFRLWLVWQTGPPARVRKVSGELFDPWKACMNTARVLVPSNPRMLVIVDGPLFLCRVRIEDETEGCSGCSELAFEGPAGRGRGERRGRAIDRIGLANGEKCPEIRGKESGNAYSAGFLFQRDVSPIGF
ncbi:4385_t:CDS:2 [Acaulospora colombiana]|uniref:4385_t:CDS:1 n=1 Tax=Acaulospora colombiana TaxID=27376 RepID=A0ACA9MUI4_9GLOM|nr:4385_t:CDS:2 [Acaulospora colombiana]